jgi:cytochrome P450
MLENVIGEVTYLKIGLILLGSYLAYSYFGSALESRRINALGGRTARRKALLPFGLELVYEAITASLRYESLHFWLDGFEKYGNPSNPWTVESAIGGERLILTADPENIKAILATQFTDYGKGKQFNKDFHDFLGDSIFTTDGQQWHDSRQLIRPLFIKDRLSDIEIFEKHCQQLIPMLGGQGQTVDACDLFFRFTLDAATDFLLGRSVDSLTHEQVDFARAFNTVQHVQGLIAKSGPLNWIIPRGKFRRELKVMNEFTNQYIDDALRLSPDELEKRTKNEEGYTFLHALAGFTRDRTVLRDQLVAILLAGRDTTACTLSWMFYELSKYPHMVAKLRREILETVGEVKKPSYADMKSMKYLQVSCPSMVITNTTASLLTQLTTALPQRDSTHLSHCPVQRQTRPQGHNSSPGRRPRWQPANGRTSRHTGGLLHPRHATTRGHLPPSIRKVPASPPIRA